MAAKQDQFKVRLNLLFPQGAEPTVAIKFLKWILSYGRYMAIFVEILVITAFLTRFKLDRDLSNINNQINSEIYQINQQSDRLIEVSQAQTKLSQVKSVYDSTPDWQDFFDKLDNSIPSGTKLSKLTIDSSQTSGVQFKITGTAASNQELALLINSLNSNGFKGVTLTNASLDQGQMSFSLSGEK